MKEQSAGKERIVEGVISIVIALIIWLIVRGHSPHMEYGEMLANMDNWILKEPFYSIAIFAVAVLALNGAIRLYLGLQMEQKTINSDGNNNANIFCSECGAKCSANSAFCNKCGFSLKDIE